MRSVSLFVFTVFVLMLRVAQANEPGAPTEWRAEILGRMRSNREISRAFYVCPADIAGAATPRNDAQSTTSPDFCEQNPETCYKLCNAHDGAACINLAYALDDAKPEASSNLRKGLYAEACSLGEAAGCTNRAAELRNSDGYDPLDYAAEPAAKCEYRSFKYACERADPWGCAMLGQALLNGEGVDPNLERARATFRESCNIDADSDACRLARKLDPAMRQ